MTAHLVPVTVRGVCPAPVERTFATVVPIDLTLIFRGLGPLPGVVGTADQSGPWDRVGVSRKAQLSDGSAAFERITAYQPPGYFEYEISGFTNVIRLLVTGARGDWKFAATADGGTAITWTYAFRPRNFLHIGVRLFIAPVWHLYMRRALEATIQEVRRQHLSNRASPTEDLGIP
jgi:Polyketide cyclase / dehydrase and lipid transport